MALVAAGAATCVAGAGLACITAGPGYPVCFAALAGQCASAAAIGFEICTTITFAELVHCMNDYYRCLKGKG